MRRGRKRMRRDQSNYPYLDGVILPLSLCELCARPLERLPRRNKFSHPVAARPQGTKDTKGEIDWETGFPVFSFLVTGSRMRKIATNISASSSQARRRSRKAERQGREGRGLRDET